MSQPKAIVIGASRGIGLGLTQQLQSAGYDTYRTIRSEPTDSNTFQVDLNDPDAASVKAAAANFDSLDVLVVNGAIAAQDVMLDISPDRHREYYQTNVVGPLTAVQAFLPALRKGKHKTIVLLSSAVANAKMHIENVRRPADQRYPTTTSPYAATKGALNITGISIYNQLSEQGFSVLLVHPGLVRTDMAAGFCQWADSNEGHPFKPITIEQSTSGIVNVIQSHIAAGKPDVRFVQYDGKELEF